MTHPPSETRTWLVAGRVQGVAFRASARREAVALGLRGVAENLNDGRVRVIGIGEPDALERFERWLAEGPPPARVDSVDRIDGMHDDRAGDVGFVIR